MSRTRLIVEINDSQISVSGTVNPDDLGVLQKLLQDQGRNVAVHLGNTPIDNPDAGPAQVGEEATSPPPAVAGAEQE